MFGISSYWRNDWRGKCRHTKACSVAHHSCLNEREPCSLLEQLPPQTSSPRAACSQPCQQPVPLRDSGSDSCPGWKHLPGRLPKRPGPHPLESPSVQVRFGCGKNEYGKACMATSPRTIPSLKAPGDCILSLWTGQEGGGDWDSEEAGDLILCNLASLWRSHVPLSMVPRKISHACFPSESMGPK